MCNDSWYLQTATFAILLARSVLIKLIPTWIQFHNFGHLPKPQYSSPLISHDSVMCHVIWSKSSQSHNNSLLAHALLLL